MSQEKDKVFFRNFSLVVGGLAVLMVVFIIAARIVGIDENAEMERKAASVEKLTAPMGEVSVAEAKEPAAPAEEAAATDTAATASSGDVSVAGAEEPAAAAAEVAATDTAAAGSGDVGKQIYDGLCVSCHGLGPAMAAMIPQFADKAAWAPRIAQGNDILYKHAIEGFTGTGGMMMPPKGGGSNTDDEVKAAVDYMVSNSQ